MKASGVEGASAGQVGTTAYHEYAAPKRVVLPPAPPQSAPPSLQQSCSSSTASDLSASPSSLTPDSVASGCIELSGTFTGRALPEPARGAGADGSDSARWDANVCRLLLLTRSFGCRHKVYTQVGQHMGPHMFGVPLHKGRELAWRILFTRGYMFYH